MSFKDPTQFCAPDTLSIYYLFLEQWALYLINSFSSTHIYVYTHLARYLLWKFSQWLWMSELFPLVSIQPDVISLPYQQDSRTIFHPTNRHYYSWTESLHICSTAKQSTVIQTLMIISISRCLSG